MKPFPLGARLLAPGHADHLLKPLLGSQRCIAFDSAQDEHTHSRSVPKGWIWRYSALSRMKVEPSAAVQCLDEDPLPQGSSSTYKKARLLPELFSSRINHTQLSGIAPVSVSSVSFQMSLLLVTCFAQLLGESCRCHKSVNHFLFRFTHGAAAVVLLSGNTNGHVQMNDAQHVQSHISLHGLRGMPPLSDLCYYIS